MNTMQKEGNSLLEKLYLQEFSRTNTCLLNIKSALDVDDIETAKNLLHTELHSSGQLAVIQQRVNTLYPEFTRKINQALTEGRITKLLWQVGHCLKLGLAPVDIAKMLPTTNRSVSVQGTTLRRLGILEPSPKATKPKKKS